MLTNIVLVAGGCPELWPDLTEYLEQEIFWVGIDRGSLHLIQQGIIPNMAVGDFDSLSAKELSFVEENVAERYYAQAEKDETDTQMALRLVMEKANSKTNYTLIGATGGRLDHFLANLWLPLHPPFATILDRLTIKDQQNTVTYFKPGKYSVIKEADKKYLAYVTLTPVTGLTLYDAKYALTNYASDFPISFASNEFVGKTTNFSFKSGRVAVIQSCDL